MDDIKRGINSQNIEWIRNQLKISYRLAHELLILAGGDEQLVVKCSNESIGLGHCKALILDRRINKVE